MQAKWCLREVQFSLQIVGVQQLQLEIQTQTCWSLTACSDAPYSNQKLTHDLRLVLSVDQNINLSEELSLLSSSILPPIPTDHIKDI